MIDALVSGSAARAVFIQGSSVHFIDADDPENLRPARAIDIPHLLLDANDIVRVKIKHYTDCFDLLLSGWRLDRALRMLQIILANDDEEDTREASSYLEKFLKEDSVQKSVRNVVYSVPYDEFPDISDDLLAETPTVKSFYWSLREDQRAIAAVRAAFNALSFPSTDIKSSYEGVAVPSGLFAQIVDLSMGRVTHNEVTFTCLRVLASLPNSRALATEWLGKFAKARVGRQLRSLDDLALDDAPYELDDDSEKGNGHLIYKSVRAQIDSIIGKLDNREVDVARRFANQLVAFQRQSGSSAYLSKSLSSIAMEARRRNLHDIELEWAQLAAEVRPQDGWARALLGDTFLSLYRLQDAEREFKAAFAFGEEAYGMIGLAKVAKESGDLDAALEMFGQARSGAGHHAVAAWVGYCGTLKEMWKPDETLLAYQEALAAYPSEPGFRTGYAKSLQHLGRFDEAIRVFAQMKTDLPGDPRGYCGEAEIYKHAGQFEEATKLYERAVRLFPYSLEAQIGLADLFRKTGEYHNALDLFKSASGLFPYSPLAQIGAADVLLNCREYHKAINCYDEAVTKFPLEPQVRNGRANAYKRAGNFAEALRLYDENVRDFPYNLPALAGRANLLKLLGKYDDAINAYDVVLGRQPRSLAAKAAKASILIAERRYDEAGVLLSHRRLSTRNDWLVHHVRGMLELRRGNVAAAQDLFSEGLARTPFHGLRSIFRSSLACCDLQMEAYDAMPEHLKDSDEPVHVLLRSISLAFSGRFETAAENVEKLDEEMPPKFEEIRRHLSGVLSARSTSSQDRIWLLEASEEALLRSAA